MKLSEKLYQLRRRSGLSQEQAAERLGVSRQAVSKWEGGQSVPDPDNLAALSRLYGVTTDYLLLEDAPEPAETSRPDAGSKQPRYSFAAGLLLCLVGAGGLLVWGLTGAFSPAAAARLDASSAVTLNGSGILALLCAAALAAGVVLLLRKEK